MTGKARRSYRRLFKEDFKPQWMVTKERAVEESLGSALQDAANYRWRLEAYETIDRISKKHAPKKFLQ